MQQANIVLPLFFKGISEIILAQTNVDWFGSLSAPTDSGLEDFGNVRNFGKDETLFFTILSRSSFPKFCLLLACLLACLPACLLVGWLVGWLAGWLAGWMAGSCRGSVLGRDMPTMDIHGEDISTIDRDVGGERFTQNCFSKAFSTQWSGF